MLDSGADESNDQWYESRNPNRSLLPVVGRGHRFSDSAFDTRKSREVGFCQKANESKGLRLLDFDFCWPMGPDAPFASR